MDEKQQLTEMVVKLTADTTEFKAAIQEVIICVNELNAALSKLKQHMHEM